MEDSMVTGLLVVKKFLTVQAQDELTASIDAGCWSTELERRVQHFGYRYDYKARRVSSLMKAMPLPEWGRSLVERILAANIASQNFDQLIVNEYLPGQGIAPHIDCIPCFDNEIVSISLGSSCVMTFSNPRPEQKFDILLEAGDLLLIRDKARYEWRHQINPRKRDRWQGRIVERERRISLTFRKILQL
ncbi:MAG: alpha-ketoglutarate-dependent dioxygenase AlkB [Candidatus Binatia bacterium]